jgi:hypothetical protein
MSILNNEDFTKACIIWPCPAGFFHPNESCSECLPCTDNCIECTLHHPEGVYCDTCLPDFVLNDNETACLWGCESH